MNLEIVSPLAILLLMMMFSLNVFGQNSPDGIPYYTMSNPNIHDTPAPFAYYPGLEEARPINYESVFDELAYPELAANAGMEGEVMLRVLVDEEGRYMQHLVMYEPHPQLSDAVETQLPRLAFQPGSRNGQPHKSWVNVAVAFELIE